MGSSKFIPQYFRKGSKVIVWDGYVESSQPIKVGTITADAIWWGEFDEDWSQGFTKHYKDWLTEVDGELVPTYMVGPYRKKHEKSVVEGLKYTNRYGHYIVKNIRRVIEDDGN